MHEVNARPFDLVITDLNMPDLDGAELTEAIRQTSPDTAVVWITAYGCHSMSSEATRLGIHRCYDKPLEVDEILQVARDALANRAVHLRGQR
jgi:DNA-binding NtrC family response regulator